MTRWKCYGEHRVGEHADSEDLGEHGDPFEEPGLSVVEGFLRAAIAAAEEGATHAAADDEPTLQPPTDPAEISLRAIEERYNRTTPDREWWRNHVAMFFRTDEVEDGVEPAPDAAKAALVPEIEEWLAEYEQSHRDLAPLARVSTTR